MPAITRKSVVLPHPLGPSSDNEFAGLDLEADVVERLELIEALVDRATLRCSSHCPFTLYRGDDVLAGIAFDDHLDN